MKKFDSHVHALHPNGLETSLKYYKQYLKNTNTEKICFMSCPTYEKGDVLQNLKMLYFKSALSPNGYAYAGLYYENFNENSNLSFYSNDFYNQVKTYVENGYDGIKLLEGKPSERKKSNVMLQNPVYDKAFSYLEENGVPITLHNSDPATFWNLSLMSSYQIEKGWYVGDCLPSKADLFKDVIAVLKCHPKLKLTLAHFGFTTDAIWEAEEFLSYENTRFDVTPGWEQYVNITENYDAWRTLILNNSSKIIYGTDTENDDYSIHPEFEQRVIERSDTLEKFFFTNSDLETLSGEYIKGINLPKPDAEKILYYNALNELKTPKPINLEYVKSEINRVENCLKTDYDALCFNEIKNYFNNL